MAWKGKKDKDKDLPPEPKDTVFITGLPPGLTEAQCKAVFDPYGETSTVSVMTTGAATKCSALIKFTDPDKAQWVVDNLNGQIAQGLTDPIKVKMSGITGVNTDRKKEEEPAKGAEKGASKGMDKSGNVPVGGVISGKGNRWSPYDEWSSWDPWGGGDDWSSSWGPWADSSSKGKGKDAGFGDSSAYVKTKMCTFFAKGMCTRGVQCTFAHSPDELKAPAPGAGKATGKGKFSMPGANSGYKTRLCMNWEQMGSCPRGATCTFAHGAQELQASPAALAAAVADAPAASPAAATGGASDFDSTFAQLNAMMKMLAGGGPAAGGGMAETTGTVTGYKKEMCQAFATMGMCVQGANCTFAHSPQELQP
eukprot:gnl/TRDRNA2_/TRDRNA2_194728_c0_seq1.p1 gnl/TRDRNA2_/TRDRNA2_194728_c0~~gnl/TRDRNA2_/TRDRNA2_194728_c0_seq1.p1  ORF type:complete len:365 (-),score=71.56 gnl/TRDRNA2_/TRDRNA2_194728_c0_seq1:45-1139(-)